MEDIEDVVGNAGGRFAFCTLLMKRMRALMRGSPKLIDTDQEDPYYIARDEYRAGRLRLLLEDVVEEPADEGDASEEVSEAPAAEPEDGPTEEAPELPSGRPEPLRQ